MTRKKRLILFAGAGASRACGYALTAEILPEILRRLACDGFDDEHIRSRASALAALLDKLMPGDRSAGLPLITEVLSVIDHCLASGEELLPAVGRGSLSLLEVRWLLERAMTSVIRKKLHTREVQPKEIAEWVLGLEEQDVDVTVLSTNYDVSLDGALLRKLLDDWNEDYVRTDFGFTWRDGDDGELVHPSADARLRLYKLHGSLNWLGCNRCGNVYVNFYGSIVQLADGRGTWSECHCGFKPLRAVLVAPSFVRQLRDRNLLSVWRSATEALRRADDWVFVGYSLPTEDVGVRALLMRGLFSRELPPQVSVVSTSDAALPRYRLLFRDCRYTSDGLRKFLDDTCRWLPGSRTRKSGAGESSKTLGPAASIKRNSRTSRSARV